MVSLEGHDVGGTNRQHEVCTRLIGRAAGTRLEPRWVNIECRAIQDAHVC